MQSSRFAAHPAVTACNTRLVFTLPRLRGTFAGTFKFVTGLSDELSVA
jgi:hypothetical protein